VEAFGWVTSRPHDRMGIAYFYNALNSDFQNAFSTISPIGDVHGGEVYYNAQVTPWFHLTADLQAVEPAVRAQDTALVLALRAKIDF
jgi:porin